LKFDLTEKSSLRLAGSLSQTLPEFKEIAPFEYVSPQGQVTRGNPDLEASRNFNVDVKYEFFPSRDELFSVTTFFKQINDPINKSLNRGGEDIFSFFNTGDQATVFGIELEGRAYIIKKEDDKANLRVAGNVSYISHEQDLRDVLDANGNFISTFKYGGKEKIGLQGASDWTSNLAVTWNSGKEHPYEITLSSNYSSDRIFSLGAPRNQTDPATFFNGEITEKGVVEMDFILNKEINKHWSIGILARNLLNPTITRSQLNQSPVDGIARQDDVLSYSKGINASLSVNYNF
jgi:outer membrane receptor protein involved in Fe transport